MSGRTRRAAPIFIPTILLLLLMACEQPRPGTHVISRRYVTAIVPAADTVSPAPLTADTSYLEHVFANHGLVDVRTLDSTIAVDLSYADTSNVLHFGFYDGLRRAYMTCDLAIRVANAQRFLKQADSSLTLVILDAARPQHIQQVLWDSLRMTPEKKIKYLTPPELTSLHNYGCAVDVTIAGSDGRALDMGSAFDQFDSISQPRLEEYFRLRGQLSDTVVYHRRLLRYVMRAAGLRDIATEWWHYSLCTKPEAMARYQLIR